MKNALTLLITLTMIQLTDRISFEHDGFRGVILKIKKDAVNKKNEPTLITESSFHNTLGQAFNYLVKEQLKVPESLEELSLKIDELKELGEKLHKTYSENRLNFFKK